MEFPKKLYVTVEEPGTEDQFFLANEKAENIALIGEKITAAIYELKEISTVETKIEVKRLSDN